MLDDTSHCAERTRGVERGPAKKNAAAAQASAKAEAAVKAEAAAKREAAAVRARDALQSRMDRPEAAGMRWPPHTGRVKHFVPRCLFLSSGNRCS